MEQRAARDSSGLLRKRGIAHADARESRVADGDAVDASADENIDDRRQIVLGNIRSQLDHDRPLRLARRHQLRSRRQHPRQEVVESGRRLQVAKPRRVWRGDIDREVARHVIEATDALHIVGGAIGRVLVGADVDADDAPRPAPREPRQHRGMPPVVEAQPVDQRAILDEPEHARTQITFLRPRGDSADLGKTQPHTEYGIVHSRALVEARRNAQGIRKRETAHVGRQARVVRREAARINPRLQ